MCRDIPGLESVKTVIPHATTGGGSSGVIRGQSNMEFSRADTNMYPSSISSPESFKQFICFGTLEKEKMYMHDYQVRRTL